MNKEEFSKEWKKMMKSIAIDLGDEFDENFERKAFFDRRWKARLRKLERGVG